MAGKRPAEQWYTGDWYRAVDVQKCCPATRGIWRDALDAMVNEQITGKIRGTKTELCRLLRCSPEELERFLDDNSIHKFANVTKRNEKVTIICRRLYRVYLERQATKKRVRHHREKAKRNSNADVTPYSSSSSSSSCNNTVTLEGTTLQDCYDSASLLDIPKDYAKRFYEHYQPQGWKWGNGVAITDLRGALQRCWNKGYTFKSEKKQTLTPKQKDAKNKKRIREEHEEYLRSKSTEALLDIKKDKGHLWGLAGWLIEEILRERR